MFLLVSINEHVSQKGSILSDVDTGVERKDSSGSCFDLCYWVLDDEPVSTLSLSTGIHLSVLAPRYSFMISTPGFVRADAWAASLST